MRLKKVMCIASMMILILALAGCGEADVDETYDNVVFRYGGENICLDEVYIYAETVKESYESKYGADVWKESIVTDEGLEMDAQDAARREAISKIVKTKTLITKSEEYGITLTEKEVNDQVEAAQQFYELLTDEQISSMDIKEETVERVLTENALADKIYEYVMKQSSTEVSDEQARMSTFYDMFFECYSEDDYGNVSLYSEDKIQEQRKKAYGVYESIVAQSDTLELNISLLGSAKELKYAATHTMSRDDILNTYGQEALDVLYGLSDGEISPVVETEYGFHIFQMQSITDEAATAENKEKLSQEADEEYYDSLMEQWTAEIDSGYSYNKSVNQDIYGKITFE
jgi:hypothetical protein